MQANSRKRLMRTKQNKVFNLEYSTVVTDGVVLFTNVNTTLGFVRFKPTGAVEYIFVQPMYRRQGLAKNLLHKVQEISGHAPVPEPPVSPLGQILFKEKLCSNV
jgi:GNAT superfamily N-acetyltransferase